MHIAALLGIAQYELAPLVAYQHDRGWGKSSFMSDIQIVYLIKKQNMLQKSNDLLLKI